LLLLALVLGAWELLPRAGIVNPLLLPPLSDVLAMLANLLARSQVQEAVAVTAGEVILAFIVAVPLGAAIGVLAAENDYFGEVFQMPQLFAGVILLAAVAIAFNETVRWLEARCSTWRT